MKKGTRQHDVADLISADHGRLRAGIVCDTCSKPVGLLQDAADTAGAIVVRYMLGKAPGGVAYGEKAIGPGEQRHIVIFCPRHGKLACDVTADTPMGTTVRAVRPETV